jgi:TP901 family phage tail tape measure protein
MAFNSYGLGFVFSARDLASGVFDRISRGFTKLDLVSEQVAQNLGQRFTQMKRGFAGLAAGAALLFLATLPTDKFAEFELAIAKTGAVANASAKDMKVLTAAAGSLTNLGVKPVEGAKALEMLASQGFNAQDSIAGLKPSLMLAIGGMIEAEEATKAMTSTLNVFGLGIDQAGIVSDKLLKISNVTTLRAADLELAMGTVGRGASAAKQGLDETLIAMGLVKGTGVDASVAASSVSAALVEMAAKADAFKKIGVNVVDAQGKFRPFLDVILDTNNALAGKNLDDAKRVDAIKDLFGRFGMTAFSAAVSQLGGKNIKDGAGNILNMADAVAHLRKEMAGAGGTAQAFVDRIMNTFQKQKDRMAAIWDKLVIEFGRPFAEVLGPIIGKVAMFFEWLTNIIQATPAPIKRFIAGAVVLAGTLLFVGSAIFLLVKGFAFLQIAAKAGLISMIPALIVGAKIAAIIGLVAATANAMGYTMDDVAKGVGSFVKKVSLFGRALFAVFSQGGWTGELRKELNKTENQGLKQFVITLYRIGSRIIAFFKGVWGAFKEVVGPAGPELRKALAGLNETLDRVGMGANKMGASFVDALPGMEGYQSIGAAIGATLGAVIRVMMWVATKVVQVADLFIMVGEFIGVAFGAIYETIDSIGSAIGGAFRRASAAMMDFFEKAKSGELFLAPMKRFADSLNISLSNLYDTMIRILRELPDWALPENVKNIKHTLRTTGEMVSDSKSRAQFASLGPVDQKVVTDQSASAAAPLMGIMQAMQQKLDEDRGVKSQAQVIQLVIDGAKIAEVVANQQAAQATRSFKPVTVAK